MGVGTARVIAAKATTASVGPATGGVASGASPPPRKPMYKAASPNTGLHRPPSTLPGLSATSGVADAESEQTGGLEQDDTRGDAADSEHTQAVIDSSVTSKASALSKAQSGPPPAALSLKTAGHKATGPALKATGMLSRKRKVDEVDGGE